MYKSVEWPPEQAEREAKEQRTSWVRGDPKPRPDDEIIIPTDCGPSAALREAMGLINHAIDLLEAGKVDCADEDNTDIACRCVNCDRPIQSIDGSTTVLSGKAEHWCQTCWSDIGRHQGKHRRTPDAEI